MKKLGHRAVIALLVPDASVAFKILALNTEKAHNLREKSLEAIRMARALADTSDATEHTSRSSSSRPLPHAGRCLRSAAAPQRRRVSANPAPDGRVPGPRDEERLKERERRGKRVLRLDEAVGTVVDKLKKKGLTSP